MGTKKTTSETLLIPHKCMKTDPLFICNDSLCQGSVRPALGQIQPCSSVCVSPVAALTLK